MRRGDDVTIGVLADARSDSTATIVLLRASSYELREARRQAGRWSLDSGREAVVGIAPSLSADDFLVYPIAMLWIGVNLSGGTANVYHGETFLLPATYYKQLEQVGFDPFGQGVWIGGAEQRGDTVFTASLVRWRWRLSPSGESLWKTSREAFVDFRAPWAAGAELVVLSYKLSMDVFGGGGGGSGSGSGNPSTLLTGIDGPSQIDPVATNCRWYGSASGGEEPYSFEWYRDGGLVGTGTSYAAGMNGASQFEIQLWATDAAGNQGSQSKTVLNTGVGECWDQ